METVLARSPMIPTPRGSAVVQPTSAALLVITDDAELRDLLLELAIEEGYGVRCVETDAEAGTILLAERPGLVVADLDMATGAGGKFLRLLRRSPHRAIPCIGVTGTNDTMLAVSIDAPVFFKPALTGFVEALHALFTRPAVPPLG